MKVGIIGHGYVGSAVAHSHRHDHLVIRDPKLEASSASMQNISECDVIYACLPSPSRPDGTCDTSYLEHSIAELMTYPGMDQRLVISKTTAPPTTYESLHRRWPSIVHVPEFLTANNHIESYESTPYFVLGGSESWCQQAQAVLRCKFSLTDDRWMFTDIVTASLYKYMMNTYLATKVTFLNEFYLLSESLGVDFQKLTDLAQHDHRIGPSHMQVPGPDGEYGWGGACFPKDLMAILKVAKARDLDFGLLACVNRINHWHRDNR